MGKSFLNLSFVSKFIKSTLGSGIAYANDYHHEISCVTVRLANLLCMAHEISCVTVRVANLCYVWLANLLETSQAFKGSPYLNDFHNDKLDHLKISPVNLKILRQAAHHR